jgi:DNA invertase Pin-like site-specific DNA recombinase
MARAEEGHCRVTPRSPEKKMRSLLRAATYSRYSTDKQAGASLADQRRVCEQIAKREGFTITHNFEDAAISGGTAQRPGYQSLLAAARRHEFDAIFVEDVSRLWREMAEQWRAVKELADLGVHIIGNGIDTRREEESRMLLAVNGAAAEGYRAEIGRRSLRGLEGRAREHKSTGGKCFGYQPANQSSTGEVEVNPQQERIVRQIFENYAAGSSPLSICRQLNAAGVRSPGSYQKRTRRRIEGWQASAIAGDVKRGVGILRNRRYLGEVAFGRFRWKRGASDSSKRKVQLRSAPLHVYREERLRIISDELWDRVQARLAKQSERLGTAIRKGKRRAGAGRPSRALLSNLLRCGQCEGKFGIVNGRCYGCSSHVNGRPCAGTVHYVKRDLVETLILRSVEADLLSPESTRSLERFVVEELRAALMASGGHDGKKEAAEIRAELGRLATKIAAGEGTEGALLRCNELTALLRSTEAHRARNAQPQGLNTVETARDIVRAQHLSAANVRELLNAGDTERARDALGRLTGEIRLVEAREATHLVAMYDLGVDQLVDLSRSQPRLEHLARLSELVVAGARLGCFRCRVSLARDVSE